MRKFTGRDYTLIGIIGVIFTVFVLRFGYIQIINAKTYADAGKNISSRTVTVEAARGEILDRNGFPIVTNRQGNSVVFDAAAFPSREDQKERNRIIFKLITYFREFKEDWNDNLPLVFDSLGNIVYKEDCEDEIELMKSRDMLNLNSYATAQNCLDSLIDKYELEEYSLRDARDIASVCYEMLSKSFSISNPFTFADDVSNKLVSVVKENSADMPGIEIEITTYREYTDGTVAPHIVGMTGAISAEEYEKNKNSYSMTDIIGKNGIELAMEKYLKGKNGIKTYYQDADGKTRTENTLDPVQGNSVILTIDFNLQKITQKAIKECLDTMKKSPVSAGSAVVIKVDSGEVLAAATYPGYDITKYNKQYKKLSKNIDAPLWNRAFLSTYTPGSTMKPSIAIAGLEEGIIDTSDYVYCNGKYKYSDITLGCTDMHGGLNVINAIYQSCNIFFYDLGSKLGITTMNKYRKLLGFSQKTGIEIEEANGTLDSPSYRQSIGQVWYPGFTIQSAIGNAGDQATPVQLANYCATIANGGTRYKCTLIKSIKSYDYSKTVYESKPEVACKTGISNSTLNSVREGMLKVGTIGFCQSAFYSLPVKAAAKTGTSQVERNIKGNKQITNNGFLITYAPYDKPEIAICVALEGASSGASVAPVARDIYSYYFNKDKENINIDNGEEKSTSSIGNNDLVN